MAAEWRLLLWHEDVARRQQSEYAQMAKDGSVTTVLHDFAANLQARLEGREAEVTEIAGGSLFLSAIVAFVKRLFGRG